MSVIIVGCDPGLRNTGLAAVERLGPGQYRSRGVRMIVTLPNKDKAFSRMRTSSDDQRRIRVIFEQIVEAIKLIQPHGIALENYVLYEPKSVKAQRDAAQAVIAMVGGDASKLDIISLRELVVQETTAVGMLKALTELDKAASATARDAIGVGQAAKTIAVYGATLAAAYAAGLPVFVFEPSDRARRFLPGNRRYATKDEVGKAVTALVEGHAEQVALKVPQRTLRNHVDDGAALAILGADAYAEMLGDNRVGGAT